METVTLDSWTSLFLFASVQGFFLAFLLWVHKKGSRKANRLLSVLILLFSLTLLYYVSFWTGFARAHRWVNGWTEPFIFLFGPLAWLYVCQVYQKKLPGLLWIHFLPAALNFLWMIPFLLRNIFGRVEFLRQNFFGFGETINQLQYVWISLSLISLFAYALVLVTGVYSQPSAINHSNGKSMRQAWIKKISWFFFGFTLAYSSYWLLAWSGLMKPTYDYMISVTMSAFIYMVGYLGFHQPEIMSDFHMNGKTGEKKYVRSTLTADQSKLLVEKLLRIMTEGKPYLDSNLKIQQLADMMDISSHHLSQLINENLQQNFADFINSYRINEARQLLISANYENEKVLSVAFDSGFSNKATFNTLFKKHTGMSPSEFRKRHQPTMS